MLGAPPAFVLSQDQTLYKWYLSLKSVKSCFAQHAIACVLCELLLELFLVFFQTLKRFLTSFSILFNFQGPVRLSLAADDLFILPPKWFFVKPYFLEAFELSELGHPRSSSEQTVSLSGWVPSILLSQDRSVCLNAPLGRFIAFATAKLFSVYWFFSRAFCWGFGSHSFASAFGAQV